MLVSSTCEVYLIIKNNIMDACTSFLFFFEIYFSNFAYFIPLGMKLEKCSKVARMLCIYLRKWIQTVPSHAMVARFVNIGSFEKFTYITTYTLIFIIKPTV